MTKDASLQEEKPAKFNKEDFIICYCKGLTFKNLHKYIKDGYNVQKLISEEKACCMCKNCKHRLNKYAGQINQNLK